MLRQPVPSPGLAEGRAKNQKEGPKTRRGCHTFKIQYWMYVATGGPNVKWGGTDFKWEGRAPLAPLATALTSAQFTTAKIQGCVNVSSNSRQSEVMQRGWRTARFHSLILVIYTRTENAHKVDLRKNICFL